jgi:DNA-binding response OmpR family regulator
MPNQPRPHVLIVSDDTDLSAFLSEGLVLAGFWTSVIASALQTIEVFRLRTFDAVIVDAALQGLGAAEMRRRLGDITNRPMLAIAASPAEMSEPEAQHLGFVAILYPPVELENLAPALFSLVSSWRAAHPGEPWADEAAQSAE